MYVKLCTQQFKNVRSSQAFVKPLQTLIKCRVIKHDSTDFKESVSCRPCFLIAMQLIQIRILKWQGRVFKLTLEIKCTLFNKSWVKVILEIWKYLELSSHKSLMSKFRRCNESNVWRKFITLNAYIRKEEMWKSSELGIQLKS